MTFWVSQGKVAIRYTGEVGKCTSIDVKFSQDLTHQKSLQSVNF